MRMALASFGSPLGRGETSPRPGGPGNKHARGGYNEAQHEILRLIVLRHPLPGVSSRYGAGRPQHSQKRRRRRHGGRARVGALVNADQPWVARQFTTRRQPPGDFQGRPEPVHHLRSPRRRRRADRKSTRLNSSHGYISYAVFCLKKKNNISRDNLPSNYNILICSSPLTLVAFSSSSVSLCNY